MGLRATMRRPFVPAVLLVAAASGGCSLFGGGESSCESVEEYQEARSAQRLSVPAGLDAPDATGRLEVPEGPAPAEPLSRNAACLQRLPNYFDRPLNAPSNPAPLAPPGAGASPPKD